MLYLILEFKGKRATVASVSEWRGLMDADLEISGYRSTFKNELEPRVLLPQVEKEKRVSAGLVCPKENEGRLPPMESPLYSLILFGPPGTAKTTTCTSMATCVQTSANI